MKPLLCGLLLAALLPNGHMPALTQRLHDIVQQLADRPIPDAPVLARTATPTTALGHLSCDPKHSAASRFLRYGTQIVNAFVVGNAIRRGSQGHVFGKASSLGFTVEYATLDFAIDHLDRSTSCRTQNTLNALFALGALYNAGQTEFPR